MNILNSLLNLLRNPILIQLLGIWVGLEFAERSARRRGISSDALSSLTMWSIISALLGARLSYLIQYPQFFIEDPASIISPNPGLFDPWGGLAAGLIAAVIYMQRKELLLWPLLDSLTSGFAAWIIAFHISNWVSGRGYGMLSDLPWSMNMWGQQRHPAQLYEAIAAALILAAIWWLDRRASERAAGILFLYWVTATAAARLFFEAFRADSSLIGDFRAAQIAAWGIMCFSIWAIHQRQKATATAEAPPNNS